MARGSQEGAIQKELTRVSAALREDGWAIDHGNTVSVGNHGHGIPAEIADQIFDPFITGRSDGLGLGLSISQSIVDAHGGELHVHARQGGGTCFTMLLPRVQEKA